jgi:O-6-methylguanine DNA methyltransferase
MSNNLYTSQIDSPIGKLFIASSNKGICMLEFDAISRLENHHKDLIAVYPNVVEKPNQHILKLEKQLSEYFSTQRKAFDVPIDLIGTDFQIKVWKELLNINYGVTRSYKEQSIALGDIKAIRAVANTNGQNKIAIVIPCHRVIGSDGSLTGFGGGLWRKEFLLNLESKQQSLF